ncbi:MAG: cation-translocating P-type ATPase [Cyclobacteriaceae bacterium]
MLNVVGLTTTEAQQRLKEEGFNELPSGKPKTILTLAKNVVQEPMFLLLITCGVLYLLLGDYLEGIVLMSSILVILFITFYQYRKTERALDVLKNLSSPRALVLRNGQPERIPGREVVRGDLVILHEGDRVAADGLLVQAENLLLDESLLTGESISVSKNVAPEKSGLETPGGENTFNVFAGTMVQGGRGMARILATGEKTQLGKIGLSLKSTEEEQTSLQRELKIVVRRFGLIGIGISLSVFVLYYFSRKDLINALLSSLSSAMAILPEEFPVVMTVFLALGAWRISRSNVLTRKPAAIESLGSATVLCADKTGTITLNKMTVSILVDAKDNRWTQENTIMPESIADLLRHAAEACPDQPTDPMEKAIQNLYINQTNEKLGIVKETYPLSPDCLAMTIIRDGTNGRSISCKGAVEAIAGLCKLSPSEKERVMLAADHLATRGLRVLGISEGVIQDEVIPKNQSSINHRFLGLVGLEDPIRPEVPKAMEECRGAGIRVIMITGDYPATARSIGRQVGLDDGHLLTGNQIASMSLTDLRQAIKETSLCARVLPEQKLRIVEALKQNGEVVAMTGDGINDAPALKAAHIGIAMGLKGTDVAREASSLVLLDDNFASIVGAVRLGRRIYDNLQKAMMYILAIHIPIIGLTLLPAVIPGIPFLLFPLHIVFMELIIDPVCSIAFESEPEEIGLMKKKPREPQAEFFGKKAMTKSIFSGLLLLASVLIVYFWSIGEGHSEGESRALAFTSLILSNIGFILSSISRSRNVFQVLGEKNPAVKIILVFAVVTLSFILVIPGVRNLFGFEAPDWPHFIPSVLGSAAVVGILEVIKIMIRKKKSS